MALAIRGEHVPDIEFRQAQQVAEVLFVFVAIEATAGAAAGRLDLRFIGGQQGSGDGAGQRGAVVGGESFLLRRHLAFRDDIVKVSPAFAVQAVLRVEGQGREDHVSFGGLLVVTLEAGLLDARERGGVAKARQARQAGDPKGVHGQGAHLSGGRSSAARLRTRSGRPSSRPG